jgi:hypothetical protein
MECQVADPISGKRMGEYIFLFDTASSFLSVAQEPRGRLFGADAKNWTPILAQGGHAVFYYIADDTVGSQIAGRVRVLDLNFEKPNMFNYWMGGELDPIPLPYKANCRRLN